MKIILWPTHYLPSIGGLEMLTHSLGKQLQRQGHEVIVLSNNIESEELKEFTIEGVKVFLFPFIRALHIGKLILMKKIMHKIEQIFKDFIPDLINTHGWFECFSFYQTRVIAKTKIPLCITVHGLLEQEHYQTLECQKLWNQAKVINTVSQALLHSLNEKGLVHPNLHVIYNGLSISPQPLKPLQHHPPTLVMVGRLSSEKCFNIAFHALAQLVKKYPDMKLILVGGGLEFNSLNQLKSELQLDAHIHMTDFVRPDQVNDYLDQATLVLIPSYYESFSLIALEAALRARPVVASNVYGLKEVVEHNKTGILITPEDPDLLAKTIDDVLSQPKEILQKMGAQAHERASRLFTIEKTTEAYLQMYQNIMEQ